MSFMGTRNLPFTYGTPAYGLEYEHAISALSLNTSIIFGIDKTSGSITKGKDVTFFISTGIFLDMIGNKRIRIY